MDSLTDTRILTGIETRPETLRRDAEEIADAVQRARVRLSKAITYATVSGTLDLPSTAIVSTWSWHEVACGSQPDRDALRRWTGLTRYDSGNGGSTASSLGTPQSAAATVNSIRALLRRERHDKRLARLSPERRLLYDRITALRDSIGPVGFDVTEALRELRSNG